MISQMTPAGFRPANLAKDDCFTVIFHGKFIPLQGVQYIVQSAVYLSGNNIKLKIIGDGQMKSEVVKMAKVRGLENIEFLDFMPAEQLPFHLSSAHVGLGIFGDTGKARRVIPNKAYEILAMGLPLITGDSEAVREGLSHGENCILCPMADPKAIAKAILKLKADNEMRQSIADSGFEHFNNLFSPKAIGKIVREIVAK